MADYFSDQVVARLRAQAEWRRKNAKSAEDRAIREREEAEFIDRVASDVAAGIVIDPHRVLAAAYPGGGGGGGYFFGEHRKSDIELLREAWGVPALADKAG